MRFRLLPFSVCISEQLLRNVFPPNLALWWGGKGIWERGWQGKGLQRHQRGWGTSMKVWARHQRLDMPFLTANESRTSLRTFRSSKLSISSAARVGMRDDSLAHFQGSWLLFARQRYRGEVIDRCCLELAEKPQSQGSFPLQISLGAGTKGEEPMSRIHVLTQF